MGLHRARLLGPRGSSALLILISPRLARFSRVRAGALLSTAALPRPNVLNTCQVARPTTPISCAAFAFSGLDSQVLAAAYGVLRSTSRLDR